MSRTFEMSASGPLGAGAVVECGVCWWTYDPQIGAREHDLFPGIAFSRLPSDFRCPECDAPKDKFMLKPEANDKPVDAASSMASQPAVIAPLEERLKALEIAYGKAEDAMVGLPVHNPKLKIDFVAFRAVDEGYAGVVITPWSMNIALLPFDPSAPPHGAIGSKRDIAFPSGVYEFLSARLDGFGALETCNLISPMEDFDDPAIARMTAEAAFGGLMTAPETAPTSSPPPKKHDVTEQPAPSRRAFLTGNRSGTSSNRGGA